MNLRLIALLGSIALYAASLPLPAILFKPNYPGPNIPESGAVMLWFSLWGLLSFNFAGVANLLLFVSLFLLGGRKYKAATICLGIALLFTLETFQLYQPGSVWFDEGGVKKGSMLHPLIGYYIWMFSIALPFSIAVRLWRTQPQTRSPMPITGQAG